MPQTNAARLTTAMNFLRDTIQPAVERELKRTGAGWWTDRVLNNVTDLQRGSVPARPQKGKPALEQADLATLLRLMDRNWFDVFKKLAPQQGQAWVRELQAGRNLGAHQGQGDVDQDTVYRLVDTAALVAEHLANDKQAADYLRTLRVPPPEETEAPAAVPDESAAVESEPAPATPTPAQEVVAPKAEVGGVHPWRDVATPRNDVLVGSLTQAQFAADLSDVATQNPNAGTEYLDPVEFFERTFLTRGMSDFLQTALNRLMGQGGDPVVQLKTGFGGGKTHTMVALYHLAKHGPKVQHLEQLQELAQSAGGEFPQANVAVLVGTHIDSNRPYQNRELQELGLDLRTLWGHMAWQLGGYEAFKLVQDADVKGSSPGSATLRDIFERWAPCVVLIDELVAFARNLERGQTAGSFEANMTFIQALTEAARSSKNVVVAASIPESDMEVGGERGWSALGRIENTFGRIEAPWTPVQAMESFEVVRRRIFKDIKLDRRDDAVRAFSRYYRENGSDFPVEARERAYEERLRSAYPFHPELFDRLYEDWNAIPTFQSTRGVLRLLARIVQQRYQANDASALIMPGTIPLEHSHIRDEFLRYIAPQFGAVIDADIAGPNSEARAVDHSNPRFVKAGVAEAVASTIFLGSVPDKGTKGLEDVRIRLGACVPGESVATYNDALGHLNQRLQYLHHSEGKRYWFEVRPNLIKTVNDRMSRINESDAYDLIEQRLKEDKGNGGFDWKHVAPKDTGDVPDDTGVRLIVAPPSAPYDAGDDADSKAVEWARNLLDHRANQPRIHRNTLVFAAADSGVDLTEPAKRFLAWSSIVQERDQLNLDELQVKEAQSKKDDADRTIAARLQEAYKWLITPKQRVRTGINGPEVEPESWEALDISGNLTSAKGLAANLQWTTENREIVLQGWAPQFLAEHLEKWFWSRGLDHVSVKELWEDYLTRYLYFPRLKNRDVLANCIITGTTSTDYFGYADGYDGKRYTGLKFGERPMAVLFDGASVVVRRDVAAAQKQAEQPAAASPNAPAAEPGSSNAGAEPAAGTRPTAPKRPTQFYGQVTLPTLKMSSTAGQIGEEIVSHLAGIPDADVEVVLEVRARIPNGVAEDVERTVLENAKTLKFDTFEFEDS